MEKILQDLRYAARMMMKSPGFTAVAVLSLALGIGANTTIFTIINALFLRPLPLEKPAELMSVYTSDEKNSTTRLNFLDTSYPNFLDYRAQNDVFSSMSAYIPVTMSLSGNGMPEQLNGMMVTGNYFDMLGVKALAGRTFLPEEDVTPGTHPVVVLGYGLWQRRFGGDLNLIGKNITLNGHGFAVIGVAPENFHGTVAIGQQDFWAPVMMHDQVLTGIFKEWFNERRALLFRVIGRLKPGVSQEQAQASLQTIASRLEQEYPKENEKRSAKLLPLLQSTINPNQREVFVLGSVILMTIVGLVLLIACANVANLLIVRATARRREIAIRLALGASRWRLFQQLITESLLLSLIGGSIGLLLADWGRNLLWAYRPTFIQQNDINISLDSRVLLFTLLISFLTGAIFGALPAIQSTRPDLVKELKDKTSQRAQSHQLFNMRNLLVIAQMAFSLLALIGAGLFLRSLLNAQDLKPGFEIDKLMVMTFDLGSQGYDQGRTKEFYRRLRDRLDNMPELESAAIATNYPLGGGFMRSVSVEGQQMRPGEKGILTLIDVIDLKYFQTAGIALAHGRNFTDSDRDNTRPVAVITEAMAHRFWPNEDAIGKRFKFFGDERYLEVVGIVKDSAQIALGEEPTACVYLPLEQNFSDAMTLYARAKAAPQSALAGVRGNVQELDNNLPITNVATMPEIISQNLWGARMSAILLLVFGLLALMLAAIGIYGILAYSVSQRTQEIGIRMALGAQRGDVLKMVLKQAMLLVALGILLGLASSLALAHFVSTLLFGISAFDPVTFIIAPAILAVAGFTASLLPARKATRVDPIVALRWD